MITPKSGIERCPECGQPVKAIDLRRLGIKCSKYDRWEIEHMNYEHGCGNTMHGMTKKELVNAWNRYARSVERQRMERVRDDDGSNPATGCACGDRKESVVRK